MQETLVGDSPPHVTDFDHTNKAIARRINRKDMGIAPLAPALDMKRMLELAEEHGYHHMARVLRGEVDKHATAAFMALCMDP